MKLTIGNETIDEPQNYKFQLNGNKLSMVNDFNPLTRAKFSDNEEELTVPRADLDKVRRRLTEARNRKVVI